MSKSNRIDWKKIVQAVVQAIIAALTALGVSSCVSHF
ncbi:smalltalk protein [Parabacteroides sp.]